MSVIRAGFVGIGNMGSGMALNIAKAVKSLAVYDSNAAKCKDLHGLLQEPQISHVKVASNLKDVAKNSDVVCLSLAQESVCEQVLFGGGGIVETWGASAGRSQKTIIEHGTFSTSFVANASNRLAQKGIRYLDAPVSGGPERARLGTLSVMVGGDDAVYQQMLPLLSSVGSNVVHMGPTGSGIAAKLVNQLLVGVHAQAASEAISLAQDLGLKNVHGLLQLLNSAWGNSVILQKCGEQYLRAEAEGVQSIMHSAAPLRNMAKDFDCIERSVADSSTQYPCMRKTHDQMKLAESRGFAEADFVALQLLLKSDSQS